MRIGPVHRGQRGTRGADQPDVISTAVGGDDEVSEQAGRVWLDQHMRLLAFAGAAGGVANDPAGRIAARDGNQVLTRLKRDVGDQPWRGIDLKDRPLAVGVDQRAIDRKSTRLNTSQQCAYRMPSSA